MYITEHNYREMIRNIDKSDIDESKQLFKSQVKFLTKLERRQIFLMKMIAEHPEILMEKRLRGVDERQDNPNYLNVYGGLPSYHASINCDRLNSEFKGFRIPKELMDAGRGPEAKDWYRRNRNLNPEQLEMRFHLRFGIKYTVDEFENSGVREFDNRSVQEIEVAIKDLLAKAESFGGTSQEKKIINAFGKIHYITKRKTFESKYYNTIEVKEVIQRFNKEIRYPLIQLLQAYFIRKYNSKLEYDGKALDQLGFKSCGKCCNANYNSNAA
jgi:uncharacterized protein YlbG (UPF0298 family)